MRFSKIIISDHTLSFYNNNFYVREYSIPFFIPKA